MSISVILVSPEIPENIGFVARSMKCFGAKQLILVGVRRHSKKSRAYKTGHSAKEILESALYFPTLAQALAPFELSIGFSRRWRGSSGLPFFGLEEFTPTLRGSTQLALVFGRESQGLNAEELALLDRLVYIPMEHPNLSLNLSHAVGIVLHEMYNRMPLFKHPLRGVYRPSSGREATPSQLSTDPRKAELGTTGQSVHNEYTQGEILACKEAQNPLSQSGCSDDGFLDSRSKNQNSYAPQPSPGARPQKEDLGGAASFEKREAFFSNWMLALEKQGAFTGNKAEARKRYCRQLWQKISPTTGELDFLYGLFSGLSTGGAQKQGRYTKPPE